MADITHIGVEEMDSISGVLEGITFCVAPAPWKPMARATRSTPTTLRVGPAVKRKVLPGPEGLRLLTIGGRPGHAYELGGAL